MPFISRQQEKWMFANKPDMAKEWASKTDQSTLPEKVSRKGARRNKKKVKQ